MPGPIASPAPAASTAPIPPSAQASATSNTPPPVFAPAPPPPGSSTAKEPSSASPPPNIRSPSPRARRPPTACASTAPMAPPGTSLADLDSEAVFNKHAVDEIASLADLRKAPLVEEEYHGPLLCSAPTPPPTRCARFLAAAVTATRPALGTEARTNGPFASSYHARVLPDFMNVVDDPSLKTFDGKGLARRLRRRRRRRSRAGRQARRRRPPRQLPHRPPAGARLSAVQRPRPRRHHRSRAPHDRRSQNHRRQRPLRQPISTRSCSHMAKDRGLQVVYFVQTLGGGAHARACSIASASTASASWCAARCSTTSTSARCAPASKPRARTCGLQLLRRCAHHRPRSRAALQRCHRPSRQRQERQAALLSAARLVEE